MPGSVNSGSSGGGRSGGGGYSPNATIITTGGGGQIAKPKSLINSISEIQQFYVIEKQGQNIPGEFLTLEGSLDFFKIGAKSGMNEGLFILLLLPAIEFYLLPFVFKSPPLPLKMAFGAVPYLPLIVNTMLCAYIGRYYIGNITRKAINALFSGRMIMLAVKSFVIYVAYTLITGLSTPERVWSVAKHAKQHAEAIYTGYMTMLPHIMPVVNRCAIIMLLSAILPYGAVFMLDQRRRAKINRNRARIAGASKQKEE